MREVFISYKSNDPELGNNDETVANELCQALEAAGITCWIAPRDIEPGKRFARAIIDGINNCKVMIVVFSRYVEGSEHIANEIDRAFRRRIDIIPFSIDGSHTLEDGELGYYLCRMQWVKASGDYRLLFPNLIADLRKKLGKKFQQFKVEKEGPSIQTFIVQGVSFNMIRVEGGVFTMGATQEQVDDARDNEKPDHQVLLSSFYIGETQVTQELWQAVMGNNPSKYKGNLQRPVESVSWDDCQIFIKRLNQEKGMKFRLPTEAEWEFAARGGNKGEGLKFAGGNNINEVAWFRDNSNETTHAVKGKIPNELEIYDMSGNVFEWCQDNYDKYIESSMTLIDPVLESQSSTFRVTRGGSWFGSFRYCRVSSRGMSEQSDRNGDNLGLRLALDL